MGWRSWLSWSRRYAYEQQTFAMSLPRRLQRDGVTAVHVADPVLAYRLHQSARENGYQVAYKDGLLLGPQWCRQFPWVQVLAPQYLEAAQAQGIQTDGWFVIPHFVDSTRFQPPTDRQAIRREVLGVELPEQELVVLGCGDFSPQSAKRLEWLIAEVESLGVDARVRLILAGQATPQEVVHMERRTRTLGDRVHLLPNRSANEMPRIYQCADVFAHAATREPFGIVLIEAMATGLPVVAHTYPVTEWIVGRGGTTVDMTVRGTLALVLSDWIKQPGLWAELGAEARARASTAFAPETILPRYRELQSAMRSRSCGPG